MAPRFVEVPADRFQDSLNEIGKVVEARGGSTRWIVQGRERVWELHLPAREGDATRVIRVFTSMARGATVARNCGKDAVRVVVGFLDGGEFRPIEKGQKILRTAPRGAEDRVAVFLGRLRDQLRKAWVRANKMRRCPLCGKPMALRKARKGVYVAFYGCTTYPECKGTGSV